MKLRFCKRILVRFLFIAPNMLTGCATIYRGPVDSIFLNSREPGTEIRVNDVIIGTDSALANLPKKGDHIVRGVKSGCQTTEVLVKKEFDPVSLFNFVAGVGSNALVAGSFLPVSIGAVLVDYWGTGALMMGTNANLDVTPKCGMAHRDREPSASRHF